MEYGRHGEYRRTFYADVCARATEVSIQLTTLRSLISPDTTQLSLTDSIKMSRRPGRPTPIMNSQDEAGQSASLVSHQSR